MRQIGENQMIHKVSASPKKPGHDSARSPIHAIEALDDRYSAAAHLPQPCETPRATDEQHHVGSSTVAPVADGMATRQQPALDVRLKSPRSAPFRRPFRETDIHRSREERVSSGAIAARQKARGIRRESEVLSLLR